MEKLENKKSFRKKNYFLIFLFFFYIFLFVEILYTLLLNACFILSVIFYFVSCYILFISDFDLVWFFLIVLIIFFWLLILLLFLYILFLNWIFSFSILYNYFPEKLIYFFITEKHFYPDQTFILLFIFRKAINLKVWTGVRLLKYLDWWAVLISMGTLQKS